MLRAQLAKSTIERERMEMGKTAAPISDAMVDEDEAEGVYPGDRSQPIAIPGRKQFNHQYMADEDLRFHGSMPLEFGICREEEDSMRILPESPCSWRDQKLEFLRGMRKESSLNERRAMNLSVEIPEKQEKTGRRKEIDWKRIRERVQQIRMKKRTQCVV